MTMHPKTQDNSNPPDHRSLLRSMTENFTSVYLTMLSIIQGVAFTDLANIAFSEHTHFTIVQWLQVATMLWSLMYIWNHFMGDALMTHWVPELEDAALLFGTGVFELVANHGIIWGVTQWLATLALMLLAWSGGTFYITRQEEHFATDSMLLSMLRQRMRPLRKITSCGGVVLAALAVLCGVTHSGAQSAAQTGWAIALASVAAAFAISILIGATSSAFFRRVRHYANTGEAT